MVLVKQVLVLRLSPYTAL